MEQYDKIIELAEKIKATAEVCKTHDAKIVKVNGNRLIGQTIIEMNIIASRMLMDYE